MKEELIGKSCRVIGSSNKELIGIEGKIIDETRFTIIIAGVNKERRLLKANIIIEINGKKIDGKTIAKKPEERIRS